MGGRRASWLAWSACVLSLALTALSFLLILLLLHSDTPIYYYWLETSMVAVGYSTVGAIVASRLPESPIGWLFCAIGLSFAVVHFSAEYAIYALLAPSRSVPGGEVFAWLTSWVGIFGLGLVVFLDLLFPNGRLPSARWRWFARFTAIALLPAVILSALSPGLIISSTLDNPLGLEGLPNVLRAIEAFMYALIVVGVSSMLGRLRQAGTIERQQIKWFAYATVVVISGVILKNTVYPAVGVTWVWWVGLILTAVGVVSSPIVVLQSLFVVLIGEKSTLAVVASTLVIAALFTPFRRRIQSIVDRRFYRRKYDARKTLETFSAQLRNETDLEALRDDLVGVVRETMQPAHISLWLRAAISRNVEKSED
jgi:hypothetical protein